MPTGSKKNTRAGKKTARAGAAAFTLGLFLAGPQTTGVAAADPQDDNSSAPGNSADTGSASGKGAANRGAAPSRTETAGRADNTARAPRAGVTHTPAPTAARPSAATASESRSAARADDPRPAAQPAAAEVTSSASEISASTDSILDAPDFATPVAVQNGVATNPDESAPQAVSPVLWRTTRASVPAPAAAVALPAAVDTLNAATRGFFTNVTDWLNTLPTNHVTTYFEGALLMLRRNLFNQVAIASPVQTSFDPTNLRATITGGVGAEDPEGDPLAYAVTQGPQYGTVEVTTSGDYVYTPGEGFTGQDSFTVNVTSGGGGINLFDLASGRSTAVTVLVGTNAPTNPFSPRNIRDVALYLGGVPMLVTVGQGNPLTGLQSASITLKAGDDYPVTWLDDQKHFGHMSVADVVAQWEGFESAGDVRLGVDFELQDGSAASVIITSATGTYRSDSGEYVFSGYLAPDPADGAGVDSYYDITGKAEKTRYENFRATYLDVPQFNGVQFVVDTGDLYADSYSLSDYQAAVQGTDPGTVISPGQTLSALRTISSDATAVNAMLSFNGRIVTGLGTGEVKLWADNGWTSLGFFGSAVQTMLSYKDGFVVGFADGSVRQWSNVRVSSVTDGLTASAFTAYSGDGAAADTSTSPKGEGAAQAFDNSLATKYLNFTGPGSGVTIDLGAGRESVVQGLGLITANDGPSRDPASYEVYGSSDGKSFTKISSGLLTPPADRNMAYGDTIFGNDTAYRYYRVVFPTLAGTDGGVGCSTSCMQVAEIRLRGLKPAWTELQGAGWAQPVSTMMAYGDGFVVGLGATGDPGAVMQWTGTQWKELMGTGWKQPVSTMIPYQNGFVIGLGAKGNLGAVQQWTGTEWKELMGTGWKQPVSTMIPYQDGFVVGLGTQGDSGAVMQWTGSDWKELQGTGWKQPASTLLAYHDGLVVGLGGYEAGAVQFWDKQEVDDVTDGFGVTFKAVPDSVSGAFGYVPVSPTGEDVVKAFDNSFTTKYLNYKGLGSGAIINLGASSAYAVNGLALYTGSDSTLYQQRDPVSYELFGWDPYQAKWIPVSSGVLTPPSSSTAAYPPIKFDNSTAYTSYKLTFPQLRGSDPCGGSNSCMQVAEIELPGVAAAPSWQQLQGVGWKSAVTSMIPFEGGFLVGLANGAVEKWTPTHSDGHGQWQELAGNQIPLTEESMKAAIQFAKDGGNAVTDNAFDPKDPLFLPNLGLQPKCMVSKSCDGSLYALTSYADPATLLGASKSFALGAGTSVDLSYDLGTTLYGYAYVPAGLWAKLRPSNYSAGMLTALTTGPSLTVNLGDGSTGVLNAKPFTLVGPATLFAYPPFLEVSGKIDASIGAEFQMPDGTPKTSLAADFYYNAGLLTTLNVAQSNGFQFGFASYGPTLNYEDFQQVSGLTVTPKLIPSITTTAGLFTPSSTPIIGRFSLVAMDLKYSNPVSVSMTLPLSVDTAADLRFNASGLIDFQAGVLPELTSWLTYQSPTVEVYKYASDNLLAPSKT